MSNYTPDRNDLIEIDFEPVVGKEIGKVRPAIVLSNKSYNEKTGLLICCPVSTSIRGERTEVPINNLQKRSVVASSIIQTMAWRDRRARFLKKAEQGVIDNVLVRLIPLIGGTELMTRVINDEIKKRTLK